MRRFALLCTLLLLPALAAGPRRAPGFSLPDIQGQQHDLADYRGKIVLLEFTGTQCHNCEGFAGKLEQLKTYYGGKVAVIAVTNPPDAPQNVVAYLSKHKLTYPFLFDCGQVAFSYVLPNPLRPSFNTPRLFVIDRAGMLTNDFEFSAGTTEIFLGNGLSRVLDQMLAGNAPAAKSAKKPAAK